MHVQVSIIIVSYNVQSFLELCLDSVERATQHIAHEIFVVDNASSDGSISMIKARFPNVRLLANQDNVGFSKANNQALALAQGKYVHFLNPDTVLPEDFYLKAIPFMEAHPNIGALGPKLIDAKGNYAPDSKKAFPSFWVSVYKVTGLSRMFPRSTKFNKYYRQDIDMDQPAPVDILSGCCLLIARAALDKNGGGFDESYFMYCEDVDLCYRLRRLGYVNYYFPEVTVIHYKGESTRKLSFHYMKIFYRAHALFVKRYYPRRLGLLYINALRIVLALRNFFHWLKHLFVIFKMFLLDALLLSLVTILVKNFWFRNVANRTLDPDDFLLTLPIFLLIWLSTLFLNGAYDKPFSLFKTGRGMIIGTMLVLAGYSLFPTEYRYSRAVVLFSGMAGTLALLFARWLLASLGWIRLVPRGKSNYKAAIAASPAGYHQLCQQLEGQPYFAHVIGRISCQSGDVQPSLGSFQNLHQLQTIFHINEFILNAADLRYQEIIQQMHAGDGIVYYKIQATGSRQLVGGSHELNNAELYFVNQKYAIDFPTARRNKRILDIAVAVFFLVTFPLLGRLVANKKNFFRNITQVLWGKKTWISYEGLTQCSRLPKLKPGVAPPFQIVSRYSLTEANYSQLAQLYATDYVAWDDIPLIKKNLRYLGT